MTDTPKTASDALGTAPPIAPPSPPTKRNDEAPLPVGDPEVIRSRSPSEKPRIAPAPVKI